VTDRDGDLGSRARVAPRGLSPPCRRRRPLIRCLSRPQPDRYRTRLGHRRRMSRVRPRHSRLPGGCLPRPRVTCPGRPCSRYRGLYRGGYRADSAFARIVRLLAGPRDRIWPWFAMILIRVRVRDGRLPWRRRPPAGRPARARSHYSRPHRCRRRWNGPGGSARYQLREGISQVIGALAPRPRLRPPWLSPGPLGPAPAWPSPRWPGRAPARRVIQVRLLAGSGLAELPHDHPTRSAARAARSVGQSTRRADRAIGQSTRKSAGRASPPWLAQRDRGEGRRGHGLERGERAPGPLDHPLKHRAHALSISR
jgi:hypothetical protein